MSGTEVVTRVLSYRSTTEVRYGEVGAEITEVVTNAPGVEVVESYGGSFFSPDPDEKASDTNFVLRGAEDLLVVLRDTVAAILGDEVTLTEEAEG